MPGKSAKVTIEVDVDPSDAVRGAAKAEKALEDIESAAKQVGDGAQGIKDVAEAAQELTDNSGEAAGGLSGISDAFKGAFAGGAMGAALGQVGAQVLAVFSALGESAAEAFANAMDVEAGRSKLKAQLGLTAEEAAAMGQRAGQLYSQNYGDSLDDVNEALKAVTQGTKGMTAEQAGDLDNLTADVLNLSSAYGVDVQDSVNAVAQMVKTGLAPSAEVATEILVRGFQEGNDKAGDLLDTFNEYPTSFRELGIGADQAMGLIKQGLDGGARSADLVADALKEFGIRSQDASDTSAEAFQKLGLNAKDMTAIFAKGGPEAAQGLDTVLDSLRGMQDPVERNAAAVALFGTQAEDLGDALFALDPSEAVGALGDVSGAAAQMGEDLGDNAKGKFESFKRTIETNVSGFLVDTVLPKVNEFLDAAKNAWTEITNSQWWEDFKTTMQDIKDNVLVPFGNGLIALKDAIWPVVEAIRNNDEVMQGLKIIGIALAIVIGTIVAVVAGLILIVVGAAVALGTVLFLAIAGIIAIWNKLWDATEAIKNKIGEFASAALDALRPVANFFADLWNTVKDTFGKIIDFLGGVPGKIADAARGMWDGISNAFKSAINFIIRGWNALKFTVDPFEAFGHQFGGFTVGTPTIPELAQGGIVNRPTLALIGEAGPEAVVPLGRLNSGTTINVTIQHSGLGVDSPRLQRDLVAALQRYTQREGSVRL